MEHIKLVVPNAKPVATANPRKAKSQEKQESPVESPTVAEVVVK